MTRHNGTGPDTNAEARRQEIVQPTQTDAPPTRVEVCLDHIAAPDTSTGERIASALERIADALESPAPWPVHIVEQEKLTGATDAAYAVARHLEDLTEVVAKLTAHIEDISDNASSVINGCEAMYVIPRGGDDDLRYLGEVSIRQDQGGEAS